MRTGVWSALSVGAFEGTTQVEVPPLSIVGFIQTSLPGGCLKVELLSKVVDGASGGDLILPDSVDEFHIFNDLSQAAVAW